MKQETRDTIGLMFWREIDAVLGRNGMEHSNAGEINKHVATGRSPFEVALRIVRDRMALGK